MQNLMSKSLILPWVKTTLLVICGLQLLGCQPKSHSDAEHEPVAQSNEKTLANANLADEESPERGTKLTEVAGRATLPKEDSPIKEEIPPYAQEFAGRYHAMISCDEHFVPCSKGEAEYILNLLPDGTMHRSIVHYGKVFADKLATDQRNTNYRKDTWLVNPEATEIIVQRKEGVNFYYKIIDRDHIIMDLEKINNGNGGRNKRMFEQGVPRPERAYMLTRASQ